MFKYGLGESTEFSGYHPWVNLTYYILVIGITMFSLSPWFLGATLIMSWVYSLLLRGSSIIRMNLIFTFWTLVIMALINVFFTHEGVTVLFYMNDNAITLEALMYGVSAAIMLISVIIWFTSFNVILSADKLIFLFGKAAPVLGLTLSMIFRYVPLLKNRFGEIRMGQECLSRGIGRSPQRRSGDDSDDGEGGEGESAGRDGRKGFVANMRQLGKEVGILVSWSLESSIESADSMEARGYGLKGRTSFHLYKITGRDLLLLVTMLCLGAFVVYGIATGRTTVRFYPEHVVPEMDAVSALVFGAYVMLMALPIAIDIYGEIRWKRSDLAM